MESGLFSFLISSNSLLNSTKFNQSTSSFKHFPVHSATFFSLFSTIVFFLIIPPPPLLLLFLSFSQPALSTKNVFHFSLFIYISPVFFSRLFFSSSFLLIITIISFSHFIFIFLLSDTFILLFLVVFYSYHFTLA